jgi:serine/threonine protein kinase
METILQYLRNPTANLKNIIILRTTNTKKIILARDDSYNRYVIKYYIPKSFQYEHEIAQKISTLQGVEQYVNHGFSMNFDPRLTIVYRLAKGIELHDAIFNDVEKINNKEALNISLQLVKIVNSIHSLNISHNDIKPENIIIDDNDIITLIDWEYGRFWEDDNITCCGTPEFAAPEVLEKKEYYTWQPDVWATGIVIYMLFSIKFPFTDQLISTLYSKIKDIDITYHLINPEIVEILKKVFVKYQNRIDTIVLYNMLKKLNIDN